MKTGTIRKVSGPLVVATSMTGSRMFDVVRVGEKRLVGEIIEIEGDSASIQVYEETAGIGPGESIYPTGMPLSVELGPGLIESILDGIARPLERIREKTGDFIARGVDVSTLDRDKKWTYTPLMSEGETVSGGNVIGTVRETDLVLHRIMIPPGVEGKLSGNAPGEYTVTDTIATVSGEKGDVPVRLMQVWPVRVPRPYVRKLPPTAPLVTGQRVIDTFFPVAKGGTACIPGPFGSGKTVVQHQLAKWSDADIVVYIGCGERGNEMTDVLREFPELKDPRSGQSLMKRTVLIANTSNMPVAAREASVYTGITIAEYFRDMGYSVALMADSTSRWAEAMREISGRLEEMPGDEGYPAYLGTRVAEFYERAGRVHCLGAKDTEGTLTVIGAVSPAGGDLSDPVVQATLRVVKVFWSLEDRLAFQRHFPAISWLRSYTLYNEVMNRYYGDSVHEEFPSLRQEALRILEREDELQEIVRLVGVDSLSGNERLVLKAARMIREDFLLQNAFHDTDAYTGIMKQFRMLLAVIHMFRRLEAALKEGADIEVFENMDSEERIAKLRFLSEDDAGLDEIRAAVDREIESITRGTE